MTHLAGSLYCGRVALLAGPAVSSLKARQSGHARELLAQIKWVNFSVLIQTLAKVDSAETLLPATGFLYISGT